MAHFVLTATDIAWPLPVWVMPHTCAPPGVLVPTSELPMPIFWSAGFALGQNKLTRTVLHRKKVIAQLGHDIGALIPHVGLPPSPVNTLQTVLSSRRVNFASSKVWMNARNVAAGMLTAWPPTPMTSCAEPVNLPTTCAPFARLNSLVFGMTPTDVVLGYGTILADTLAGHGGRKLRGLVAPLLGKKGGWVAAELVKAGGRAVSGLLRLAAIDGRVIANANMKWFGPYFSQSVEVVRSVDGENRITVERRVVLWTERHTPSGAEPTRARNHWLRHHPFDNWGEPLGPPREDPAP